MSKSWIGLSRFAIVVIAAGLVSPSQSDTCFAKPLNAARRTSQEVKSTDSIVSPEEVGLSSDRLERIDKTIQRSIDDGRIAGAVNLVARHGKIVYLKAFGMADREANKPMRTDNIFRLASMTKPITCVAVMILYEEGRFSLNEPVANFIPEFKNMKVIDPNSSLKKSSKSVALVKAQRRITIMHLLTHTSGLTFHDSDRIGKMYIAAGVAHGIIQSEGSTGDSIKKLASLPLLYQPGEVWEYGSSHEVLAYLVEKVSGMPFDKFCEQRIFKPLGMKDTYFFLPDSKVSRLVSAYKYSPETGLQVISENQVEREGTLSYSADYPYRGPRTYFSGGAGLSSTAEDYYRFCQMMLNGGELNGTRILSRKSVELMTMKHVEGKRNDINYAYGLGVGVISEPKFLTELGSIGSYYWSGFYFTRFVIDPKEDLIAIFMGQLHPAGDLKLGLKAIGLAYQAIN